MMAAKVHLYEYTQKIVDLFGDIPFSKAGLLGRNGGDYNNSYPEYEKADAIYKVMLDDLKSIADEMSTIQIKSGIVSGFKTQDYYSERRFDGLEEICQLIKNENFDQGEWGFRILS
jgi:hypothetical protein